MACLKDHLFTFHKVYYIVNPKILKDWLIKIKLPTTFIIYKVTIFLDEYHQIPTYIPDLYLNALSRASVPISPSVKYIKAKTHPSFCDAFSK